MNKKKISRRDFLGGAATVAAFTIVPRNVLGGPRHKPPSEKLNIAGIGVGGQGSGDIGNVSSENIVALCDVDWKRAAGTFRRYADAKKYHDFRRMLDKEDKNIDAVGNQGQASEGTRLMCEYIWDGAIGPVREVHVWTDRPLRGLSSVYWPQGVERPTERPSVPETLDWDLWLGPAPNRPYHPAYLPFNWRGWWDFGTGALGDIGCHSIDPIFRALKLGHPMSVEATSTLVNKETYPVASVVNYQFPARGDMPPVKLSWYDGGMRPRRPDELENGRRLGTGGVLFVGEAGKMLGERLIPESRMKEYKRPAQMIPRSPGHHKEWIQACKGGKPAGSNFDHAGPLAEAVLLGNVALRPELKEKMNQTRLLWDGPNLKITNISEANKFLRREYREGWTL